MYLFASCFYLKANYRAFKHVNGWITKLYIAYSLHSFYYGVTLLFLWNVIICNTVYWQCHCNSSQFTPYCMTKCEYNITFLFCFGGFCSQVFKICAFKNKSCVRNIYKSNTCDKQPFSSLYKLFSMLTECTAENNEHEHAFTFR